MNKFTYILGFFLFATLHLSALRINSVNRLAKFDVVGDRIADKLCERWGNEYSSFLDTVTDKVYTKFENHLSNPAVAEKMMVLLENDAELLNPHHYNHHNLALIQSMFFKKLGEKIRNSSLVKGLKKLGSKIASKLKDLYKAHGHKLKEMFKIMVKGFAIPLAIKFARANMHKWKHVLLKMTHQMKKSSREMLVKVIDKMFTKFESKLDKLAVKYNIDPKQEAKAAEALISTEKEVAKIEKEEDHLKEQQATE